ncbi:MAG: DUF6504 family protein [Rhizobiaceae bacterium]
MVSYCDGNTQKVFALDERASAIGLRPGLGIADARAMFPSIDVVERDAAADHRLLEALADWCDRFTPLVALDGKEGLFLDITGCTHLFGGEHAMRRQVLTAFHHQGLTVLCGIASSPGMAWALAHGGPNRGDIVEPGNEEIYLGPMPLAALRLEPETKASLESVGLRTVGAILAAPRAPLLRRFGPELLLRLDQALGLVEESISPRLPIPPLSVERAFAEPITHLGDIETLVTALGSVLKGDLERRGEGARRLDLLLFRVDGFVHRISVGASRAIREPRLMHRLFRERLARIGQTLDAGYGFDLVRLVATAVAPFDAAQADMHDRTDREKGEVALLADRAAARLGPAALFVSTPYQSHLPERAITIRPLTEILEEACGALPAPNTGNTILERPTRLFDPPECVDVTAAEVPEGPPSHFRWRRATYKIVNAEGPERISSEWWRDTKTTRERDYFRVEDATGRRYWLYRDGRYSAAETPPRWYMQGIFA